VVEHLRIADEEIDDFLCDFGIDDFFHDFGVGGVGLEENVDLLFDDLFYDFGDGGAGLEESDDLLIDTIQGGNVDIFTKLFFELCDFYFCHTY
jgi:hypothetical protein